MTKENFMTNPQGHLVPVDKVKAEDMLENEIVLKLFSEANAIHKELAAFKEISFMEVDNFLQVLGKKYGAKKGGNKGNMTLTSFDGMTRVQVTIGDFIQFGPQLQVAKQLIDECIKKWSDGTNDNIKVMVNHAFRVDKTGQVNKENVLGLRKLDIKDAKWKKAMDAITDSCKVVRTKKYIRFSTRPSSEAEWKSVPLDFASV